ncbi:MAG: hypothetical protein ACOYO1_02415 [Bacteroidales bacterium]
MKKLKLLMLTAIVMISVTSCRMTDFTVISTKNVTIEAQKDKAPVRAWGFTVKDAVDNAIEKGGVGYDALTDGVVFKRIIGYSVKGTPIKTKK